MSENNLVTSSCELVDLDLENDDYRMSKRKKVSKETDRPVSLCHICKQNVLDPQTKCFKGLPDAGLEEVAALTDDRLLLYCDGENPETDVKPLLKVTHFTVFDEETHLCPFDSGLIENDKLIYFSGYIKPIYEEDPDYRDGVPAEKLGPILEWWISGFDGGNSFLLAFSTPYAEYVLMEASPDYAAHMRVPKQKALLTKIVIEFLSEAETPTYEELLNRIKEVSVPQDIEPFDDDSLGKHAQFIIDQVLEVDDKKKLMSTPAVQEIIDKFDVNVGTARTGRKKVGFKESCRPVTTPLVERNFGFFLNDSRNWRVESPKKSFTPPSPSTEISKFSWEEGCNFAVVNDEIITRKSFVFINTRQADKRSRVFRVEYFFRKNFTKRVHCTELIKGTDTVLREASHPKEFFFLEECSDWPICKITGEVQITIREPPKVWTKFIDQRLEVPDGEYFVQKKYSPKFGTFEDIGESITGVCGVCSRRAEREKKNTPVPSGETKDVSGTVSHDKIIWQNEEYSPGCCVFLEPFSVVFDAQKSSRRIEKTLVTLQTDELIYPEFYRKAKEVNSMEECPEPFVVGYIKNIFSRSEGSQRKLFLTVHKFYRPENTRTIKAPDSRLLDFQLLFWSEEKAEVSFEHVRGRCDVFYSITPPEVSLEPQFYCHTSYDARTEAFCKMEEIPFKRNESVLPAATKLRTLNAFSGCGGLAEGLRQSFAADITWAIEIDKSTCRAFESNFPETLIFEKDCNYFLREVLCGRFADEYGNRYPFKGEVEFLCGGPPCQGFSTMNRFASREESRYNNSLILTLLSLCDYYRPKFFLMENVRNFAAFQKSSFLKHSLSSLVAMGYQCSFGVLQAGNYGLPQSRRRLFILAAAPGFRLPNFPGKTHVFYESPRNLELEVKGIDHFGDVSNPSSRSAPYRNMTVRDAAFDLSARARGVFSDDSLFPLRKTFYGNFLRGYPSTIQDHFSKELSIINEARVRHIPATKGCDWRDLPNIRVRLRDGTLTELLKYLYHDRKNGKSCSGLLRGVCCCASGKPCDPKARQNNTLIPWFLVHTANRNNNWAGLYGRLDWEGIFNTVTTNPEPSSHQGKVLHPEEDRTVSVRECARAQGLPDSFQFFGTVPEKFRQVGNAVPAPLARAIGKEIRKSLVENDVNDDD